MGQHYFVRRGAVLGLVLATLLARWASAQTTVLPSFTFAASPAEPDAQMGLTFDGTQYWSARGGISGIPNLSQYSDNGALIAAYPGLDFRSIFSAGSNIVLARTFNSRVIYQQTAPDVFTPVVTLQGGSLDSNSSVVLNHSSLGTEFLARDGAVVTRWDLKGALIGTVELIGWGTVHHEDAYPQNRGIAAHADHWFTYSDGLLSVWSTTGVRLFNVILSEAGNSSSSNYSYSFTNGMLFVGDGTTWRGYEPPPE